MLLHEIKLIITAINVHQTENFLLCYWVCYSKSENVNTIAGHISKAASFMACVSRIRSVVLWNYLWTSYMKSLCVICWYMHASITTGHKSQNSLNSNEEEIYTSLFAIGECALKWWLCIYETVLHHNMVMLCWHDSSSTWRCAVELYSQKTDVETLYMDAPAGRMDAHKLSAFVRPLTLQS